MSAAAEPTPLTVESGAVKLRAWDYGHRDAPAMVVIHGMQDFALSLSPLADAFRDDYHVVSYDLRGHGDSDKPGIYTLPHLQADLLAVIAGLELERPVLVGHSLGGHLATQFAAVFPELPSRVVNVEGIGPPMRESDLPVEDRQFRLRNGIQSLLRPAGHGRPMHDLDDAAQLFCRFHPGLDYDLSRHLVELGTEPHPHGGLQWKWDPQVSTIGMTRDPQATEECWGWIECPVLIVTGGRAAEFFVRQRGIDPDLARSAPEEIDRRVGLFRDATHVEIPEAGHMVHFDAPERLIEVIRAFLA